VLFDVDGTLVDSTYIHAVCWWQALRAAGYDPPMARIHRAVGMGAERLVPQVLGSSPSDDEISELAAAHDAIYSTYWAQLRPLVGARDLLVRCHAEGLVTVLASSASSRELTVLQAVLDVPDAVDFTTSADDASSSKPSPDILEAALSKALLSPDRAVFVGDAVWDVLAAAQAGLECIGLECGGTSAAELRDAGAVAVYQDPAELLESFGSSPLSA
jgi:HAD superfamily hydrolase (TIGR01509 family)